MILLAGCLCLFMRTAIADAQVVEIPDLILRTLIETELGKLSGDTITAPEMATLKSLHTRGSNIGDLTGLESAINLESLHIAHGFIRNLSPLMGLARLDSLYLGANSISDLSPLTGLTNLRGLILYTNEISDISPLFGLTKLESLNIHSNSISDLAPLARLTNLTWLNLDNNLISDISPLAGLINLTWLAFDRNSISDISPLARLTKLEYLWADGNSIFNVSPLVGLINLGTLTLGDNAISNLSPLAELIHLTFLRIRRNSISDLTPLVLNSGLGAGDEIDVRYNPLSDISINTHVPTLRSRGVTVHNTTLSIPAVKRTNVGDTFTLDLIVEDVVDLAGWQIDIAFNPQVLGAVSVTEGAFLSKDGGNTHFLQGTIDNVSGTITGVNQVFLGDGGVNGTGKLLSITFEAKATGRETLQLQNLALGSPNGDNIPYALVANPIITVGASRDINGDGSVNISDLILVSQNLGSSNPQADINDDGKVNIFDLIAVAQYLGESTTSDAPTIRRNADLHSLRPEIIQGWIDMAYLVDDGSLAFQLGIANLERLLAAIIPDKTALLASYPPIHSTRRHGYPTICPMMLT